MVDESVAPLLNQHPDIDELIKISSSKLFGLGSYWRNITRRIRRAKIDIAIVANPNKWHHALIFFAGIPVRIGYDRKWSFFLNKKKAVNQFIPPLHEIEKNL